MPLKLKIVNKKGLIFDGQVDFCEIPTESGIEGIMPEHINFISNLVPGTIRYKIGGTVDEIGVEGGGFIEISDNNINILLNS
jgi:F-type H+-transporting ATPase subunit epsilon